MLVDDGPLNAYLIILILGALFFGVTAPFILIADHIQQKKFRKWEKEQGITHGEDE